MEFKIGHCYYNAKADDESPRIMLCRKTFLLGLSLVPYTGLIKAPTPCNDPSVLEGQWVDCTVEVRRSEAMRNCDACPSVPITKSHVGTVIAFEDEGKKSDPHFLYAYTNGMAYLMTLDGKDRVFNLKLSRCYPLQKVYVDIAERAVADDPLHSSIFDSFFKWLRGTNQYTAFLGMAKLQNVEEREDMIKLFELMTFSGVTATTFEQEVDRIYNSIPESKKGEGSKYAVVLDVYKSDASKYSKVEREIMRATQFRYSNPKEAWSAVGGGKPFPASLDQIEICEPETPHQYICNRLGLYYGNSFGAWCLHIGKLFEEPLDMEKDYAKGVERYLKHNPEFDMSELSFISEPDKDEVFKKILRCSELDPVDPYRAWIKNPPKHMVEYVKEHPQLSYPEAFAHMYVNKNICGEQ